MDNLNELSKEQLIKIINKCKIQNYDIEYLLSIYLKLLKLDDNYYNFLMYNEYHRRKKIFDNGTKVKITKISVNNIINLDNGNDNIGYYINTTTLTNFDYKIDKTTIEQKIHGMTFTFNRHLYEEKTIVNADELEKFIENLGCLLDDDDENNYYIIKTKMAKTYGNLIIPLFFDKNDEILGYNIQKSNFYENINEKYIHIDKNHIPHEGIYDNENLKCDYFKVLNPFGFSEINCLYLLEKNYGNFIKPWMNYSSEQCVGNKKIFRKLELNLSEKCLNGFKKIKIEIPN